MESGCLYIKTQACLSYACYLLCTCGLVMSHTHIHTHTHTHKHTHTHTHTQTHTLANTSQLLLIYRCQQSTIKFLLPSRIPTVIYVTTTFSDLMRRRPRMYHKAVPRDQQQTGTGLCAFVQRLMSSYVGFSRGLCRGGAVRIDSVDVRGLIPGRIIFAFDPDWRLTLGPASLIYELATEGNVRRSTAAEA